MKSIFIFLSFFIYQCTCIAQTKAKSLYADSSGNPLFYWASPTNSLAGISLTIDSNTKWIDYHNSIANLPQTNYVFLSGTEKIGLYFSVPKDSLKFYRYRIIEDDKKWLVNNGVPSIMTHDSHVFLGSYLVKNKKLTIESYKLSEPNKVITTVIYNKEIKPAELLLTTLHVTSPNGQSGVGMNNLKDGFRLKIHDSVTVNSIVVVIKNTDINFIYHVYLKNRLTGKTILISNNWLYDYFTPGGHVDINNAFFENPGLYEIQLIPQLSSDFNPEKLNGKAAKIRFTVLKSGRLFNKMQVMFLSGASALLIAVIALMVFYSQRKKNRKKLLAEQQDKDFAQLKLSAVRSQLNPHFMFNALAAIQNLMNKNEPEQANRYLSKFARLMRSVLDNNDLITVGDEKKLLDDYLEMEQLRFGFNYQITVSENINTETTEVPAMLLQPFVENAVKHGIASLADAGKIDIKIIDENKNLILYIIDNGKGFDTTQSSKRLGLSLSKKRIELLNAIYKSTTVKLDIQSDGLQTMVKITLKNWL